MKRLFSFFSILICTFFISGCNSEQDNNNPNYDEIINGKWEMRPSDNRDNGQAIFENGKLKNFENGILRSEDSYRIIGDTLIISDNVHQRGEFLFLINIVDNQRLKLVSLDTGPEEFYINCTKIN